MRIERDSMGEMEVPDDALYGASTQRAVLNFPISDLRFSRGFIEALGVIKMAAARANKDLGLLTEEVAEAICKAADEVIDGTLYSQFVVDIFQTGSGTSTNMNANEVLANRATQLLGGDKTAPKQKIHPNDHVNMCQSSNDVIPTAIHIAAAQAVDEDLLPALKVLQAALEKKASEFANVVKAGRTHLQDATPITLGQEFSGYAAQIANNVDRIAGCQGRMRQLALGGTAVGTGLNTHPDFAKKAIEVINDLTGGSFSEAKNHFEAQASRDSVVELSGQLRTLAVSLMKIADDVRWLASGPRCGLGEITLPETQPGSSIMPAKVNPVICESVMMVAAQVMGNDACIALAGQRGNFELNVMLPVIAYNLLQSIEILTSTAKNFTDRCVSGIGADEAACKKYAEDSLSICTSLAPIIGYDNAAKVAKKAYADGKSVREAALELKVATAEQLDKALDLMAMTKPGL